jgi:hypothetical protein
MSGRPANALGAGGFFSLTDERLKLGTEDYSPGVLMKIEYAGGNQVSFTAAAESLRRLGELTISARHVERLTERMGKERAGLRDKDVAAMKARTLRPAYKNPPLVATISIDAGKAQFRAEGAGPGVHGERWGDTKVACLQTYTHVSSAKDPQPEPPAAFTDPKRVKRLCREMQRVHGEAEHREPKPEKPEVKKPKKKPVGGRPRRQRPKRLVRTVVATTAKVEEFGWMVCAEAARRGFFNAVCKAILGDGCNWIGPLAAMHFPGWLLILDFVHLLVHLFAAARLSYVNRADLAWKLYEQMLRAAWAGRVQEVIDTLKAQVARLAADPSATEDSRKVVQTVLNYVEDNKDKMDYPRYRQLGLPVSSALVESLIKQVNHRVKGTEKFWNNGGLESVLQVRGAYLSQDGRDEAFFNKRPRGRAAGRNRRAFQPVG